MFVVAHRVAAATIDVEPGGCPTLLRSKVCGARRAKTPASIKWVTVDGGLPKGVDVADRALMMERPTGGSRAANRTTRLSRPLRRPRGRRRSLRSIRARQALYSPSEAI